MTPQERIINNELVPLLNDALNILIKNFDVLFGDEEVEHMNSTLLFMFESYINPMISDTNLAQVEIVKTLHTLYSLISNASGVNPTSSVVKKTYNLRPRKAVKYMK